MGYRKNLNLYQRGAVVNNNSTKSLAAYRKKALIFLAVTVVYTAYLYMSEKSMKVVVGLVLTTAAQHGSCGRTCKKPLSSFTKLMTNIPNLPSSSSSLQQQQRQQRLVSSSSSSSSSLSCLKGGAGKFLIDEKFQKAANDGMNAMVEAKAQLRITTWNIAAINNNPFEYWITTDENPHYEKLMVDIESFIESPGDKQDLEVSAVFTEEMFSKLEQRMKNDAGWDSSVRSYWENDYRSRKIIQQFMKDPTLGKKRLVSMPDRVTNTINVADSDIPICRPTVINMYDGDLSTMSLWWDAWEKFMFDTELTIETKNGKESKKPFQMLLPISKTKYPAITSEEEKDSLPLQTLCAAIFDAILVHMMNTVSKPDVWQPLKATMVDSLNKKKVPNTLEILERVYSDSDIITLQEVSASFVTQAKKSPLLGNIFHIISPAEADSVRDQNSIIFLKKTTFPEGSHSEITSMIIKSFPEDKKPPVSNGDILAITTTDTHGVPYVIASFHGDTNGLATKPVLDAIIQTMMTTTSNEQQLSSHRLIFGLDANTYEHPKPNPNEQQDVMDWGKKFASYDLTSCWGDKPQPSNYTTFNARTYLQPQLNKACKSNEKREKGDVNPKDFILFQKSDFIVTQTWKDNTGKKDYIENMAFPTLTFPSDHGVLSTLLSPKGARED